MKSGIYKILNTINGKFYIGSAVWLDRRFRQHRFDLYKNCHGNSYLQAAFNKYGADAFEFHVIEFIDNPTKESLESREQYWLDITQCYERHIGYNLKPNASSNAGIIFSEIARLNMSKGKLGKKRGPMTQETKDKLSAANKGKKMTVEQIEKMRAAVTGVPKVAKTPRKTGIVKRTEEAKRQISLKNTGKRRSEESKLKMSIAKLGKKASEETKAKMREARDKIRKSKIESMLITPPIILK